MIRSLGAQCDAKLASHEVPPQSQTNPLKGNILPLGWCFSPLLTQEGPWGEDGVPTHPEQGSAGSGLPGASPARLGDTGGPQPGVASIL